MAARLTQWAVILTAGLCLVALNGCLIVPIIRPAPSPVACGPIPPTRSAAALLSPTPGVFPTFTPANPAALATYDTHYDRGVAYYHIGDYDHAVDEFIQAIQLQPDRMGAYYSRGLAYGQKGSYQQAIEDFNQAIQRDPNYADAYYSRGLSESNTKEYDRAIKDFDHAIQLNPKNADYYGGRGVVYSKKGNQDQAIKDFDKSIQINPDRAL